MSIKSSSTIWRRFLCLLLTFVLVASCVSLTYAEGSMGIDDIGDDSPIFVGDEPTDAIFIDETVEGVNDESTVQFYSGVSDVPVMVSDDQFTLHIGASTEVIDKEANML